jgi:hypothetical protein
VLAFGPFSLLMSLVLVPLQSGGMENLRAAVAWPTGGHSPRAQTTRTVVWIMGGGGKKRVTVCDKCGV